MWNERNAADQAGRGDTYEGGPPRPRDLRLAESSGARPNFKASMCGARLPKKRDGRGAQGNSSPTKPGSRQGLGYPPHDFWIATGKAARRGIKNGTRGRPRKRDGGHRKAPALMGPGPHEGLQNLPGGIWAAARYLKNGSRGGVPGKREGRRKTPCAHESWASSGLGEPAPSYLACSVGLRAGVLGKWSVGKDSRGRKINGKRPLRPRNLGSPEASGIRATISGLHRRGAGRRITKKGIAAEVNGGVSCPMAYGAQLRKMGHDKQKVERGF